MADYDNTRDSTLPDPASPGFRDGDTITLQNGSKFSRQSGRWEPVRFQTVGQQSKEMPVFASASAQGIEFSEPALNRAVRSAIPHILTDADIEARPPRLWPVDAVPYRLFCAVGEYALGHGTDLRTLVRVNTQTRQASNGHQFPAGWTIQDVYAGHGCALVMAVEIATNTYSLWRTEDGQTAIRVHDLGRDPDGVVHRPYVKLLTRGIERGMLNGQPALILGTYNVAETNGAANAGEIGDANYLAVSTDDGRTWSRLNNWNWNYSTGAGLRTIRHFHAIRYDKWRDCWWFCAGDNTDTESAIIRWDGRSAAPGNVTPTQIQSGAYPGWSARTGSQRWRAVDLIVTEEWIESFSDSIGNAIGGIWRVRPDFTGSHRVDHSNRGQNHDGWAALLASDGTHIWCDDARADAVTGSQRFIGLYASSNGNRYWEIGRIALAGSDVQIPRGFFEAGGNVWFSCDGEAGKGAYNTTVMQLAGKFREERPDCVAPAYFVDFANGNDAADGYGQATAWKTARNLFGSNRVTHGARIILSAGTSTENGVATIDYAANATPAADTGRPIQITGQGRSSTIVVLSGATEGWRDSTNTKAFDVEIGSMTLRQSDATKFTLADGSTAVAGLQKWTLRDAQVGDTATGSSRTAYIRCATVTAYRSVIANISDGAKFAIHASSTGVVNLFSSRVTGGRTIQLGAAKVTAKQCEFEGYANTGFLIDATASVAPEIGNCVFSGETQTPVTNNSGTVVLTSGDVYGNFYLLPQSAGVPNPYFPVAGPLERDPVTLVPFSFASIGGVLSSAGVVWDYYGNPYRIKPAAGAVELQDF